MVGSRRSQSPARVLLIDDDHKLARLIVEFLRSNGLHATVAHDGAEGARLAAEEQWDLVVLDVMLPLLDGFAVLRKLRAQSCDSARVPVLMLTARGGEDDRVRGLDDGADDYLAKTASSRELLARIRALLRRSTFLGQQAPAAEVLNVGALKIDTGARTASFDSTELVLTPVEYDLLLALARNKGRALSREQLLDQLRDRAFDGFDRSIDVHISALRRKLGDDPRKPRYWKRCGRLGTA